MTDQQVSSYFSASYFEARRKFLDACAARSLSVDSRLNPGAKGPGGEDLFTDVVRIGPANPQKALLLISGTHGVEGYCGSGPQVGLLETGAFDALPPDLGVVMIHAINPYGFAHDRRVNEDNIDLNRNFLDWDAISEMPASDYNTISDYVLPADWDGPAKEAADAAIDDYIETHGMPAFQAALSSGQYEYPDGVCYGGKGPAWSNTTLRAVLSEYLKETKALAVIDFHTGLGPYGYAELISAGPPAQKALAKEWYGEPVTDPEAGTSASAALNGINANGIARTLPDTRIAFIAAEFGTRDLDTVLNAVRADNWLYQRGEVASEQGQAIKAQILDAFYPDFDDWKRMIWDRSRHLVDQAMAGLAKI